MPANFPDLRLRRFRKTETMRNMLNIPFPEPSKFIWPVFVVSGTSKKIAIDAMPGQFRYSIDELLKALEPVVKFGVGGIMIFGIPESDKKSNTAQFAYSDNGLVQKAIIEIKKNFPELFIFTDVCMCAYTPHGHCGILEDDNIDNDKSIEILAQIATSHASAGADGVAPSAMMDGQIQAIRNNLNKNKFNDTILMSYSTKFASSMYGPFRDAASSAPGKGDRQGYQASYADLNTALLESKLDEAEGADILMVKPALFYLDIILRIKESSLLPLAAYNVSGEYSMLYATAKCNWGNLYAMARESIMALNRAGTDIFISYWANQLDKIITKKS